MEQGRAGAQPPEQRPVDQGRSMPAARPPGPWDPPADSQWAACAPAPDPLGAILGLAPWTRRGTGSCTASGLRVLGAAGLPHVSLRRSAKRAWAG